MQCLLFALPDLQPEAERRREVTQSRAELIDIVGRVLCPDDWDDPASIPRVIRSRHPLRLAEEIVAALRPEAKDK